MKHTVYVSQDSAQDIVNIDCDYKFPESSRLAPYTPNEILEFMPSIWETYSSIGTTSEAVVLWISHQIREGFISPDDVKLIQVSEGIQYHQPFDDDGDFSGHWINGFFDWRAELLF